MSLLKGLLNETRKINEEDLFSDEEVGPEVEIEAPVEDDTDIVDGGEEMEPETDDLERPEVTDEMIADLTAAIPEIADVDQAEFRAGLEKELEEHFASIGDVNIIAQIALDHIKLFPGKSYYGALTDMYSSLAETETMPEEEEGGEEFPAEEEPTMEEEVSANAELDADQEVVEEGKGKEALTQKKQNDGKALSQVKNESAVGTDVAKAGKAPGASTTPEEKKDEEDQKKSWAKEKSQDAGTFKDQHKDDRVKNKAVAEAHTADKQSEDSLKSAGKDAKKDASITAAAASKHKAEDKKDMNKKDVNPIKVTPRP